MEVDPPTEIQEKVPDPPSVVERDNYPEKEDKYTRKRRRASDEEEEEDYYYRERSPNLNRGRYFERNSYRDREHRYRHSDRRDYDRSYYRDDDRYRDEHRYSSRDRYRYHRDEDRDRTRDRERDRSRSPYRSSRKRTRDYRDNDKDGNHDKISKISKISNTKESKSKSDHNDNNNNTSTTTTATTLVSPLKAGVYIPPFRARAMQKTKKDPASDENQKETWEALRKSINGIINKVSASNITEVVSELFEENIARGRGLLSQALMKAQASGLPFTPVYAALVAAVNERIPRIGELILARLILQFKKSFKRNDKRTLIATTRFIAHLINQGVAPDSLAIEMMLVLNQNPTNDSVEVAVGFTNECGSHLNDSEIATEFGKAFERFLAILQEGEVDTMVQVRIEDLCASRTRKFSDFPAVIPELMIVDKDKQNTHYTMSLDEDECALEWKEELDYFSVDPNFLANQARYESFKSTLFDDSAPTESSNSEREEEGEEEGKDSKDKSEDEGKNGSSKEGSNATATKEEEAAPLTIQDWSGKDEENLRQTIYLTTVSSLDFEECAHKLLKIELKQGQEIIMCRMLIECCYQEKTYARFHSLVAQRFCNLFKQYRVLFTFCFQKQYETIFKLDINKIRNVAKFFAHLMFTDAIGWDVLSCIHLNERDTQGSSRIFLKILFQELVANMGMKGLKERLENEQVKKWLGGLFPRDVPKDTKYAINYFTSIGMGELTEELRQYLIDTSARLRLEQQQQQQQESKDSSSSSSDSSDSSSSDDSSDDSSSDDSSTTTTSSSEEDEKPPKKKAKYKK